VKRFWQWAAGVLGLLAAVPGEPAETQFWISSAPGDYAKAEAQGVLVMGDGSLTLGFETREEKSDSAAVYWAAAMLPDGSVALASGHSGQVDRWTAGRGIQPWVRVGAGQVFCLARDGNDLLAGTGPDGRVYRITARGDTTLWARTGERYVWSLVKGPRAWYAATGTRGRLLSIEAGRVRTVFDSDESNLVSLVSDGDGGVFAGGDSQGKIVHVTSRGVVSTVLDASENEIRALALGADGALYAGALSATATPEDDRDDEPKPAKAPSGRSVLYRIVPDSVAAQLWSSPQPMIFALAARGGAEPHVLVATGNRAGLYRVDPRGRGSLLLAPANGQLTAIALDEAQNAYVVASNPGALFRVSAQTPSRGTLTSAPLDARRYARFGLLRWHGEARGGSVRLETRSGNTDPPDSTWSRWSGGSGSDGFRVSSPPARYLQWRIGLEKGGGAGPRVESVELAYREQNLAPRVDELTVAPQGAGFREGEATPRSEPVTQTLPGGQRVEYQLRSTDARTLRALPQWVRGLRVVQWRGSDPNGDEPRFRLEFRREGENDWREIADELTATIYTWDTNGLRDGRYRVRVTASDAFDNPREDSRETQLESIPFTVDNTLPEVVELSATVAGGGVRVSGRARDQASALTRLEIAVDSEEWRELRPEGGLAGEHELRFNTTVPGLVPGDHSVSVRAVDAAGNAATRAAPVRVPGP
jgi:hypothetical protein